VAVRRTPFVLGCTLLHTSPTPVALRGSKTSISIFCIDRTYRVPRAYVEDYVPLPRRNSHSSTRYWRQLQTYSQAVRTVTDVLASCALAIPVDNPHDCVSDCVPYSNFHLFIKRRRVQQGYARTTHSVIVMTCLVGVDIQECLSGLEATPIYYLVRVASIYGRRP
jgi:hypothetical protein